VRWWRKDLKEEGVRTEVGMGDPKHPTLMCDSPGLSGPVCLLFTWPGRFLWSYSLRVGRWDLRARPGSRGALAPGARGCLCGRENSKEEALPHPSTPRPEPTVQVPQAQSP